MMLLGKHKCLSGFPIRSFESGKIRKINISLLGEMLIDDKPCSSRPFADGIDEDFEKIVKSSWKIDAGPLKKLWSDLKFSLAKFNKFFIEKKNC